ncbi:MAG: polysaccharide biosynthesis protein [Oceanicaulis sp.]|nr:polysaccharide biosynthesis protein [Oceanicaulis sp.]
MMTYIGDVFLLATALLPLKILLIYAFKLHRTSWRYTVISDFKATIGAIAVYTTIFTTAAIFLRDVMLLPITVPFIEAILALVLFVAIRLASRFVLRERKAISYYTDQNNPDKRILILGAGESGTMIAKEMQRHPEMGMIPVAFLDDAAAKQSQRIQGIQVIGPISHMPQAVREHDIDEVVIAMPSEVGDVIRRVVEQARKAKVAYRTIPGLYDLISGKIGISQIRKVQVEDLLRRNPVQLDTAKIQQYIKGRRVLVTGAGGSIGSEIVRQISRFSPESIILLGRGENSIFEALREFKEKYPQIEFAVKICDVRDISSLEKVFEDTHPEVVFHAAAHKHVFLMEENPAQAILNNVGGTKNLATLSLEYDVKYFVNISTDKAVNPTSIMGASKRIAENVLLQAAAKAKPDQIFVSVRFGNVLGSRGSVVPIFKDQISKGGPITITDEEMIRYFMTIPEASQLVLQAAALNIKGAVFVLDMGEPFKIVDMARDLIRLSGLEPDKDIRIVFTGKKEGEKLFEELLTSEEGTEMTQHDKIMIARKNGICEDFDVKLDRLFDATNNGEKESIKAMIHSIVPTYSGYKEGTSKIPG